MPTRDTHHNSFVRALAKDGWTVTHDPLRLLWRKKVFFVDVGAERVIAAERGREQIAIEIKTFSRPDAVHDVHQAAGQYIFYRSILQRLQAERKIYLAIPLRAFHALFDEGQVGELLLQDEAIRLIVFDPDTEEVLRWIE